MINPECAVNVRLVSDFDYRLTQMCFVDMNFQVSNVAVVFPVNEQSLGALYQRWREKFKSRKDKPFYGEECEEQSCVLLLRKS